MRKSNRFKFLRILAVVISFLMISQPVFASTTGNQNYKYMEDSNILPVLSSSGVTKLGDVEANKQLSITIGLKFRNKDQLQHKIKAAHDAGKAGRVVSAQDMNNNFLPSKSANNTVIEFLKNSGLKITKTYNSHMTIKATGSVQDIEKAFKVKLNYYSKDGVEFLANSTQPQLPDDIVGLVQNISGLNNFKLKPSSSYNKQIKSQSLSTSSFTPQQLQKAYDFTSAYANNVNGKGIKLAIASYNSFNKSDIDNFLNTFDIKGTNAITTINVGGVPQYDEIGSEETTMDIECALSSAPGAQLLVYDGVNADTATETDLFTQIVDDGQANVVSYSWGSEEQYFSPSELAEMNNLFMAGAAKGITFVVASGDYGSNVINYPASDPYVTAVGGTTLKINNSSGEISSETGWGVDGYGYGSGGGSSSFFSTPSWQQGITPLNNGHRMIPDVSLDADPNTGYTIYSNGNWYQYGGTSAAAPEWAAIFALVNQSRESKGLGTIGLANSRLYSLANQSVFHDIVSGSNGEYSSSLGYDMVTGLGSVDVWKLVSALSDVNTENYTVTYNGSGGNGGSVPVDSKAYASGETAIVSGNVGNLVKTGYRFAGWNTAPDGSGIDYSPNSIFTMGNSSVTLYAKWNSIYPVAGCIDTPSEGQTISGINMINGWFLDGNGVKKVEVLVDGTVVGTASYGDGRLDVARVYPTYNNGNSGYHYSLDTTKLTNGRYTIVIRETGNNNLQTNLSGRNITVANPVIGCIDTPSEGQAISGSSMINGWFLDSTGVNKIEVIVDGNVAGTASYGDGRLDVSKVYPSYNNGNSGYHYNLDTTKLKDGKHTIVIRETGNNNSQTSLGGRNITVSNNPVGCIDTPSEGQTISGSNMINGWFLDGNGVKKVEVLVDGTLVGTASYGDGRLDVSKVYPSYNNGNSGYHYSLDTTKLTNGRHTIVIRETGNNNSQTNLSGRNITVANPVIGCIDTPSEGQAISGSSMINGWFLDSTGVNKIEVLVDGTVVGTASYGDGRLDVSKVYPSYNNVNSGYHYNLDTTKLKDGRHTIVIRETGNNNSQTNLGGRNITVSNNPVGCIDTPSEGQTISGSNMINGWFLDGNGVKKVEVLVDGTVVGTASYGDGRLDVSKVYPSYNNVNSGYHYSLDTTKLTNGRHTIVIRETGNNNSQTSLSGRNITVSN
ncbi:Ig-like domain-containing protein [Clostridium pasteurianum]|uniref:Conserved repeat protein n=1 Tax=Clostridium pasteurianum BC1 TaxID=86416 RepID=R4K027_CLOPA|nr:Ig-like domain-containing protein [Clostridium pasteurianum]AGK95923.1 conserved repeat protein [Clostridium pasteurianum BC1]